MKLSDTTAAAGTGLAGGVDPLALLDEGLRPSPRRQDAAWSALSPEEVGMMLPAYEVFRIVGQGGMGAVYEAVQRDLRRRVAVKLLSPSLAESPGLAARFRHESRLMASLQHPGIVQVHEAGETPEGHLYYVMEFVDGEDLASRTRRGRLTVEEAVPLIAQVADALHAAHRLGIIHRDVKPANIFLSASGPPLLGDFGLALTAEQAADPLRLTRAGTTVGTLEYAAPEQLSRELPVSAASDVYSLGVLTYEILTGELPRGSFDPPSVRNPEVDPSFDGVVLHALQNDPARRFADAGAFRTAFLHAADRRHQQALRDAAVRRKMVRRAWIVTTLAVVSFITGGSAVLAWRSRQEAEKRRAAAESAESRMAGLFQFLLTDLRRRLEPTGNLGAMEAVLDKAVEHFRQQHESAGRSPESALKLAEVLVVKADVIGVRGLGDEADDLYTEAIALTELARNAAPGDLTRGLRMVQAVRDRSEHRMSIGRHDAALEDARRMLQEAEAILKQQPARGGKSLHAVAAAHRAVANALGYTGPLDEARNEYLEAQRLLQELQAAAPEDQAIAGELADLDMSLGSNAEAREDFPEMLRHFTAWHDHVLRHHGPDSIMHSHSAFRMGVAMVKLERPTEAIPFLEDAVRLAEREVAARPGHKGNLNHLSWCLRVMAGAHEAAGHKEQAAAFRQREAAAKAELAAHPDRERFDAGAEFDRLVKNPAASREDWWAFCQNLERSAEAQKMAKDPRAVYEEWLARTAADAAADGAGSLRNLLPAFLHNRIAVHLLEKDAGLSAEHAAKALALRKAVAAAHPEDPSLQRDALSSACHLATAAVRGNSAEEALNAFNAVLEAAGAMSKEALVQRSQGLAFAEKAASLLEAAVKRWPEAAEAFRGTGRQIAAALLDRLPPETPTGQIRQLREALGATTAADVPQAEP